MNLRKEIFSLSRYFKIFKTGKKGVYVEGLSGPRRRVFLPFILNENISCLIGMILGDGHLKKEKKRIAFEVTQKSLVELFLSLMKKSFLINGSIKKRIEKLENRKQRYYTNITNAPIYILLNKVYNIPIGKKSRIIEVSPLILKGNKRVKLFFLFGVLLTDGGRRRRGFGFSSSSKSFRDNVFTLLSEFEIKCSLDEWKHKTYKKIYYGLFFKKAELSKLMRECRSGQTGQILQELRKKFFVEG